MSVSRPVLRYHGGKFRLAHWILGFFPAHKTYVEPWGGAASVLMRKEPVQAECYNDIDGQIVTVFRVLRDRAKAEELRRRLALTAFARDEFEWSHQAGADDIDRAHRTIVRSFLGHGSDAITRACRTGFRAKVKVATHVLPAVDWSSYPDAVPGFVERLAKVVIENTDALKIVEREDSDATLIYADPPYVHETRSSLGEAPRKMHGYRFEMSEADHRAMGIALRQVRGMVVLSGYPSDLYDRELFPDWERHQVQAMADVGRRTEVVWLNPACSRALCAGPRPGRSLFEAA